MGRTTTSSSILGLLSVTIQLFGSYITAIPVATRIGATTLSTGPAWSAVINDTLGYGCYSLVTSPGQIVKFSVGAAASLGPTVLGVLTLNTGENEPKTAVLDPKTSYAYFGTNTSPGIVVKVDTTPTIPTRGK